MIQPLTLDFMSESTSASLGDHTVVARRMPAGFLPVDFVLAGFVPAGFMQDKVEQLWRFECNWPP